MTIVLASESLWRALDTLGLAYEVCPSRVAEKAIRDKDPAELTRKLAEAKAQKVASEHPHAVVVSGDADAAKNGRIYEKPRSMEEAAEFLRELSASEFQFVTALAVFHSRTQKMLSAVETSKISFQAVERTRNPGIHSQIPGIELCGGL